MIDEINKAAMKGNIYAMLSLAYAYHHGIYTECNPDLAIEWYKLSAAKGCARAKWELAKLYRDGILVCPNTYEYIHWLTASSDAGISEALMELSKYYYHGTYVPQDHYMCKECLRKAAEELYPLAEFYMGYLSSEGIILEKNDDQAQLYMERVKEHGDAELFFKIGVILEFGHGPVISNPEGALAWYSLASQMGLEKALYSMERVKMFLNGGKQDTEEQRKVRISRLPLSVDEMERDRLLEDADQCIERDEFQGAIEKYSRSAELGNADAMFMLSMLYNDGHVVRRNSLLSRNFLERAALGGCTDAQMLLARNYEVGDGVNKDPEEATRYYAMAVANGNLMGYYFLSKYVERPEYYVRRVAGKVKR